MPTNVPSNRINSTTEDAQMPLCRPPTASLGGQIPKPLSSPHFGSCIA
jgi:hypothetical protein